MGMDVTSIVKMEWAGYKFARREWFTNLKDTISDEHYTSRIGNIEDKALPKPGEIRVENAIVGTGPYKDIYCDGECYFKWILNRSGATLAQFKLVSRPALLTANIVTSGTVNKIVGTDSGAGAFTEHELVHALLQITDDADGANAAPEDEWGYIIKNTTTDIYFQPDMSEAPAAADTFDIYYPSNTEAAAAGDERSEVQGIVIVEDGIADNYWGWVCCKGRVGAETAGAITSERALIAGTGVVAISSTSPFNLTIGWAPFTTQGAAPHALIELDVLAPQCVSA